MKEGYIRIARDIEDWRWSDEPVMMYFWIRILLMANWKDKEWHDKVVKRGSFITTVANLSTQLNLSVKQVRTCLDRLRAGGEVTTDTSNNNTVITICKYDDYQSQTANEGQMNGNPEDKCRDNERATTKEYKEYNTSDTNVSSYSIPKERREEKKKEKEEDTGVSSKKDGADFPFIQKLWNDSSTRSIPKVRMLSPARKEKVRLRIKEMGGMEEAKEILATCFKKISESDFCNGATGKWTATFDWFFENEKNWLKVLEGNYDNRKEKSRLEQLAELYKQGNEYYEQQYRGYGGASPYGDPTGGVDYGPDEQ